MFDLPKMDALKFPVPDTNMPDIEPIPLTYSYSDTQFEILSKYIKDFEQALDENHEVGLILTNFGQSVTMQVTEIGYEKSVLMIFKGYVNGRMSTLIQHVSQLNFLLTSVEKEPDRPKRTIGFHLPEE
ncbi:MAG: DUF6173 family protein [Lachnospiraceae bacterium]|nr:DUF6173 family protein [Lachnospiraceae bacterium]